MEKLVELGSEVFAHQTEGQYHRLVHCTKPPQICGEWVPLRANPRVNEYRLKDGRVEIAPPIG
jgi:hypothetical protein